jgi:uncharacterized RDD family membrane protein YckC
MQKYDVNSSIAIHIPEGITFKIPLAGPVVRSGAAIIDFAFITALNFILIQSLSIVGMISADLFGFLIILSQFIISTGYGIITEWFMAGQTFGKKIFSIRVISADSLPLQFYQITVRNILRFVDILPFFYLTGGIFCLLSKHMQRLGDIAGNTIVVKHDHPQFTDTSSLHEKKYNTLLTIPHIAARIRQSITPEQASIALDALSRSKEFNPDSRIEVFSTISKLFKDKCKIPSEFTDGIPDETLVMNIMQILYAKIKSPQVDSANH